MRRVVTMLIIVLALYIALSRLAEVEQVIATFRRGNWWWLGLGVLVQALWLVNNAFIYRTLFGLLGLQARLGTLLVLAISSNFVNIAAPAAGMSGMAVFIADARRRGLSTARVTIAGVLFGLIDYFAFLCVLALGLVVLFRRNNLTGVELGATAVLLAVAGTLAGLLFLGASAPPAFERVLVRGAHLINRALRPLLRRPYLSEARAHEFAVETAEGLRALRRGLSHYLLPGGLALLGKALLLCVFLFVFLAFDVPLTSGTLVAGFSIGHLFAIVSPTPGGVGIVEGAMTLGLTSLRVPLASATVITLAFRGLTFWLPFVYGFAAWRILHWQWDQHALEKTGP